jgi:hypothetical protein
MDKGTEVEPESIKLFSKVEGVVYFKNDEYLENEWFCGHPDIFIGKDIRSAADVSDIKSSWNIHTFMPKLVDKLDVGYIAQLNVYFSLTGAKCGSIAYCLVSAPEEMVNKEKYRLFNSMNVISEESPEYLKAAQELEKEMIFEDIDYRERVIKIPFQRDDELIEKMKAKVPILREWLQGFHEKHLSQYPK